VVALAGAGVGGRPAARAGAQDAEPGRPAFDARATYQSDCATCHGARGEGTPFGPQVARAAPALVDYELSTGRMPIRDPDEETRRRRPRYSPSQIAALVRYIASLGPSRGTPVPELDVAQGDVARGGELYRLNCAACHSWSGTGGALLRREAPSLRSSTPVQVFEAVRTGPGGMPSFGRASFSDAEVVDIAAYVEEINHPDDRGGEGLWHLGPLAEGGVAWVLGIGSLLLFISWVGERGRGT
jgi:ubiquinol-cytochrome c reductase cytochrome c subunit